LAGSGKIPVIIPGLWNLTTYQGGKQWNLWPKQEKQPRKSGEMERGAEMGSWASFHITLSPGQSTRIGYTWGDDHGVSFAQPREFTGSTRGNGLFVTRYGTVRTTSNAVNYYLDIVNEGPQTASFEIMGGTF
jgi:hypothetical protein